LDGLAIFGFLVLWVIVGFIIACFLLSCAMNAYEEENQALITEVTDLNGQLKFFRKSDDGITDISSNSNDKINEIDGGNE
jgi:hypothetical protein